VEDLLKMAGCDWPKKEDLYPGPRTCFLSMTRLSSLAQQLRAIQQADHVIGGVSTANRGFSASYLFDEKEAADIDDASIWAIGKQGLEELKALDPVFGKYEVVLFGERTLDLHRAQLTAQQNESLDGNLCTFLRLLSPYFMTKAAHKALEWLIRKFRVHELNLDALMECILPYHETVQFVRMLQIVYFRDGDRWAFLHEVKKEARVVSRSFLAKRCLADRSLIDVAFGALEWLLAKHRDSNYRKPTTYFSFLTMLILDYIQVLPKMELAHVLHLYPIAIRLAKFKRVPETLQVSFMLMMQMAQRYPLLSAESLNQFLDCAARNCPSPLVPQLVLCAGRLIDLCHVSVQVIDAKTFNHLCKLPGFAMAAKELMAKHQFAHFPLVLERSFAGYEAALQMPIDVPSK
jgi:U3 small nucleolar RNA-associated protein 10